jgi:hypothetical protein
MGATRISKWLTPRCGRAFAPSCGRQPSSEHDNVCLCVADLTACCCHCEGSKVGPPQVSRPAPGDRLWCERCTPWWPSIVRLGEWLVTDVAVIRWPLLPPGNTTKRERSADRYSILCIVARTCPFCDRPADSAEHADPQWMSRYYLDRDTGAGSFTMSFGGLYPDRTVPVLNQTIRVCHRCNGGWMAILEDRVKPALIAMSGGDGLIVGPHGQLVLAQWLHPTGNSPR